MFAKATRNLVREIDPDGALITVSRLNDSDKLGPLSVVLKRSPAWFWQRPKYRTTHFTLSNLLQGKPIQQVVTESDFLKYEGTYGGRVCGTLEAGVGGVSVNAEGWGSTKLQSSFGKLRKQEVDVHRLLQDSRDRVVDLQHSLVQQARGKGRVFTVLKERIFTTRCCSITHTRKDHGSCSAFLGALGTKAAQVCVRESSTLELDSDVSMEIPPDTVIAYSVIELNIKTNGQYELCLQPGTLGGFELASGRTWPSQGSLQNLSEVDGMWAETDTEIPEGALLSILKKDLSGLKAALQGLADLPGAVRSTLFQQLREILLDRTALTALEERLDEVCNGGSSAREDPVRSLLDLLQPGSANKNKVSSAPPNQNGSPIALPYQNGSSSALANSNGAPSEAIYQNGSSLAQMNHNGTSVTSPNQNGSQITPLNQKGAPVTSANQNGSPITSANQNGCPKTPSNQRQTDGPPTAPLLSAVHLLVSAIEELTDEGLVVLESCCTAELLNALNHLVNRLTVNAKPLPLDAVPLPLLGEGAFQRADRLFSSSSVVLRREKDTLWAETGPRPGLRPLILCIAIQGLAYLSTMQECSESTVLIGMQW